MRGGYPFDDIGAGAESFRDGGQFASYHRTDEYGNSMCPQTDPSGHRTYYQMDATGRIVYNPRDDYGELLYNQTQMDYYPRAQLQAYLSGHFRPYHWDCAYDVINNVDAALYGIGSDVCRDKKGNIYEKHRRESSKKRPSTKGDSARKSYHQRHDYQQDDYQQDDYQPYPVQEYPFQEYPFQQHYFANMCFSANYIESSIVSTHTTLAHYPGSGQNANCIEDTIEDGEMNRPQPPSSVASWEGKSCNTPNATLQNSKDGPTYPVKLLPDVSGQVTGNVASNPPSPYEDGPKLSGGVEDHVGSSSDIDFEKQHQIATETVPKTSPQSRTPQTTSSAKGLAFRLTNGLMKYTNKRPLFSDQECPQISLQSFPSSPSQGPSLDSDILSLPDTLTDMSMKHSNLQETLALVIDTVAHRFWSQFQKPAESGPGIKKDGESNLLGPLMEGDVLNMNNKSGESANPNNSLCETMQQPRGLTGKRTGDTRDEEHDDGDFPDRNPPKRGRAQVTEKDSNDSNDSNVSKDPQNAKDSRRLACPYWKYDPAKHKDCFAFKLDTISRVKQHLNRKHAPIYCERCLIVSSNEESHQEHVRHDKCEWDKSKKLDGISHKQRKQLHKKSGRNLTSSNQWFVIWDIIFPNLRRPASPYVDPSLSEDLNRIREFWERRGPHILREELLSKGLIPPDNEVIEFMQLEILSQSLNRLHDEYLSTLGAPLQTTRQESAPPGSPENNEVILQSTKPFDNTQESTALDNSQTFVDQQPQLTQPEGNVPKSSIALDHTASIGSSNHSNYLLDDMYMNNECIAENYLCFESDIIDQIPSFELDQESETAPESVFAGDVAPPFNQSSMFESLDELDCTFEGSN